MDAPGPDRAAVAGFFNADARNWDSIYEKRDVFSLIHQLRRDICMRWVGEIPPAGEALEVGCGTGQTAILMARLGHRVTGTDTAREMLGRAEVNAREAALSSSLRFEWADVHELPFADGAFSLVVALGVIPWLEDPATALGEMARVLAPGGHMIVNCDNRLRLPVLLDPRYTPALGGLRRALRPGRAAAGGSRATDTVRHSPREFDAMLEAAGLRVERSRTFGFGPFTFAGRQVLPRGAGIAVHRALQGLGDAGLPPFRRTGSQHIVLARRR